MRKQRKIKFCEKSSRKIQFSKSTARCIIKVMKEGDISDYNRAGTSKAGTSKTDTSVRFAASEITPLYGR